MAVRRGFATTPCWNRRSIVRATNGPTNRRRFPSWLPPTDMALPATIRSSTATSAAALLAIYTFLGVNDVDFVVPEADAAAMILALAAGEVSEDNSGALDSGQLAQGVTSALQFTRFANRSQMTSGGARRLGSSEGTPLLDRAEIRSKLPMARFDRVSAEVLVVRSREEPVLGPCGSLCAGRRQCGRRRRADCRDAG